MDQYIDCIVSRAYCATIINPTSGSKKFSLYLPVTMLRSSEKLRQIVTRFSDLGFIQLSQGFSRVVHNMVPPPSSHTLTIVSCAMCLSKINRTLYNIVKSQLSALTATQADTTHNVHT